METVKISILNVLKSWQCDKYHEYSAIWYGYNTLAEITGYDVKVLKKAINSLKNDGLVIKLYTSSSEGRCAGSGWFLTKKM